MRVLDEILTDILENNSFQYFIVPFFNDTYKQYIDEDTRQYIEDRFGKLYATNDIVKSFIENNAYYMDVYLNNVLEQQLEVHDETVVAVAEQAVQFAGGGAQRVLGRG